MLRAIPREMSKNNQTTCSPSPALHLTIHDLSSFTLCTTRLRVGLYSHLRSGTATRALAIGPPCTNEPISKDYQKQHPSAQHTSCLLRWASHGPTLGITCDQQSPHNRDADSVRFPRQGPLRLLRALVPPTLYDTSATPLGFNSQPSERKGEN